ncbi:lysine--tRNA ligase [bacterium]|nr:lysine--tRNA ligase [bacterium]|tara:strand:- start:658 stop:2154 length:1497 start_codon:yes stop_codon:yes gene_type:complete
MSSIEEIREERLRKIKVLEEKGISAYSDMSLRDSTIKSFLNKFSELENEGVNVILAGRVMTLRQHGGLVFLDLFDGTARVQIMLKKEDLGKESFELFNDVIDTGDFVEFTGIAFTTKRGAQSLQASSWAILTKSLQQIPDEWYGIKDEDDRFRKRYLDILLNEEVSQIVKLRSKFWNTMRSFLLERDFIEVDTPVLENTTGGAEARPFVTHHNALDIDVYLRISAGELWQKRLMVAGIPKTFEIGRIFRNEGMSNEHLQDYAQLEFYSAYTSFSEGMKMVQELYRKIVLDVFGTSEFEIKGHKIDFAKKWAVYDFSEIITERFGIDPRTEISSKTGERITETELKEICAIAGVTCEGDAFNITRTIDILWKSIRKEFIGPGFLIGVPVSMEPLAKRSKENSDVVERFQVILAGSEMGKGFNELNDPLDQNQRFEQQQKMREAGDDEAQMADSDYVEALEYGMPPTFGFGVSERLLSFLLDKNIRETQLFPLMKPRDKN